MNKFVLALFVSVSLVGCGKVAPFNQVEQKEAPNRPPVIPERLTTFAAEFGTLSISSFNAFLMPEFKSYKESVQYFRTLTKFKRKIAGLQREADRLLIVVENEKTKFRDLNCRDLAEADQYNEIEETVMVWRQVSEPNEQTRLQTCMNSQENRKKMAVTQSEFSNKVLKTQEELRSFSDPDYKKDGVRPKLAKLLSEGADTSKIKIREDGRVDVTLNGFVFDDNNQSTIASKNTIEAGKIINAVYYRDKQVLVFMVPELVENEEGLVPSGLLFLFQLGRGDDAYGNATFSGKMKLMKPDGTILREGRAIIGGKLN